MGRGIAVGRGGTDHEPAVRRLADTVEGEEAHIHQPGGRLDPVLHEVDEVRTAAQVAGAVVLGDQGESLTDPRGALIGELPHLATPS
jgi:hypothetical protein